MEQNNGSKPNNNNKKKYYGRHGNHHRNNNSSKPKAQPQNEAELQNLANDGNPAVNKPKNNNHKNRNNRQKPSKTPPPESALSEPAVFEKKSTTPLFGALDNDFIFFKDVVEENKAPKYVFTEEELDAILEEKPPVTDDRPRTEIIGIRFKKVGKMYYFDPNGHTASIGDSAVVETARGVEFGQVCLGNHPVPTENIVQPLRPVLRIATPEDIAHNNENNEKEKEAFKICLEKIEDHELDMKLVDAQYTFDNSKLIFYFTSAGRVDFRELVKDLASIFRIRIELRQIGIRDEAKLIGGLGVCGRPLCCASFLSDFVQVSIKMAKEQNLSLNSNKISGSCGRLMCCLRYEHETYQKEIALTPPVDSVVDTPEGRGTVTETNPLAGSVKVRIEDKEKQETVFKVFRREDCTVISRPAPEKDSDDE